MASLSTASPSWLKQGLLVAGNLERRVPRGTSQMSPGPSALPPWSLVVPLQLPSEVHFSRQLSLLPVQLDGSTCDPLSHRSAHVPPQSLPVASPFPRIKSKPRLWPTGTPRTWTGFSASQVCACLMFFHLLFLLPGACFPTCLLCPDFRSLCRRISGPRSPSTLFL